MINQNIDMCLQKTIPALDLLMHQSQSPVLIPNLNLLSKKRSSSEVCCSSSLTSTTSSLSSSSSSPSSNSEESPMKRPRYTVPRENKVPPGKVGLVRYEPSDVLSGRGGGTNQHEGNCFFRSLINKNRERYLRAKKNDKPFISLSIVNIVRQRNGRFLKKDESSGLWFEIGDAQAREKTSQALRQRAPEYKKQLTIQDNMRSRMQVHRSLFPQLSQLKTTVSPRSTSQISSDCDFTKQVVEALQAQRVRKQRNKEIQEARQILRLHQKLQAIKVLELELMLQQSSHCF